MVYVDPSGYFWEEVWGGVTSAFDFVTDTIDFIGQGIQWAGRNILQATSAIESWNLPVIGWPIEGAGNILGGALTALGGGISGDFTTIKAGLGGFFTGIGSTLEVTAVDAAAAAMGQLSHAYTIPRDIEKIAGAIGSGDWGGAAVATGKALFNIAVPRYGFFGGAGYGRQTTTNATPMNRVDWSSKRHDVHGIEWLWIGQAWTNKNGLKPGVFGDIYRVVGTIGFGISGAIYDKEAQNKSRIF